MPLRLALLGLDEDVLALARAAAADSRFEVSLVCGPVPSEDARQIFPLALFDPDWESLLLPGRVEAVIVSRTGDREQRADLLRKLTQAKIPLLVVVPACESIVGFEVDMIRRDTNCLVLPYLPGAKHPAIAELTDCVSAENSALGTVEQLVFERTLADRGRESVLAQLARDAGLVRAIVGNLTKVSAMGVAAESPSLANLCVHLAGPPGVVVRWSVGPVEGEAVGRISLIGTAGKAVLTMPANERQWRLETSGQAPDARVWPEANSAATALDELNQALAGEEVDESWLNACRDAEIAETAQRSAIRGRTIELYQEEHSEEGTFKGVMSVGGCLMLGLGFAGLLAAFAIGGVQMLLRDPDVKTVPSTFPLWAKLWPVYPFLAFLLLQLLQLVFRSKGKVVASNGDSSSGTLPVEDHRSV